MARYFPPWANTVVRLVLFSGAVLSGFAVWGAYEIDRSPYETRQSVPREQPVPFSHEHHAGGLGLDCRYCHQTVETSEFAGIPPTKVCMNCHSQMWAVAPALEPVRESYRSGKSIQWTRVNDLPEFVYFDHSVHIHQGIGCTSCHGRVDRMPLTYQAQPLTMEWCLDCHRHPEKNVRPRNEVFNMDYRQPPNQDVLGAQLVKEYGIRSLTNCSTCHR
ncbi:MAG TPA: cytochrome c3 family protein [Bryobacteraceae bacterium]|nr:cytochrome c3 family protein [Bryobacteraceae bacterium]